MMYSFEGKLYTPEEIAGKTFSEGSKPEPLFSLEEMKEAWRDGERNCDTWHDMKDFFKIDYNITL